MSDEQYLTPDEVAKKLRVNYRTVRRWLADGKLPGTRIGERKWRISAKALEAFMEGASKPAGKP